jgi:hypothetical protein
MGRPMLKGGPLQRLPLRGCRVLESVTGLLPGLRHLVALDADVIVGLKRNLDNLVHHVRVVRKSLQRVLEKFELIVESQWPVACQAYEAGMEFHTRILPL